MAKIIHIVKKICSAMSYVSEWVHVSRKVGMMRGQEMGREEQKYSFPKLTSRFLRLGTCLIFIKIPHFLPPKKDTKFWITVPELLKSKNLWSIFLCGSSLMVSENINWIVMQSLAISDKLCFRMRNAWDFFTQLFDACKIDFASYILTTSQSRDHWSLLQEFTDSSSL